MKIKLVESKFGLFIGEEKFSVTGVKLMKPYRVSFSDEGLEFKSLGYGLSEIKNIKLRQSDIFTCTLVIPEIAKEYKKAIEKDSTPQ